MDLKKIQELIKLVKKSDIQELKVREGEFAISIKNKGIHQEVSETPVSVPVPATKLSKIEPEVPEVAATPAENHNLITFRSPMVGTFYRKPSADKDPYVKVGDSVKSGDTLCIIEAMKLFNEIEFDDTKGTIVKILAEDSSPVEYDQPLFIIEKS